MESSGRVSGRSEVIRSRRRPTETGIRRALRGGESCRGGQGGESWLVQIFIKGPGEKETKEAMGGGHDNRLFIKTPVVN